MTDTLRKMIFVGCRELSIDTEARQALQLSVVGKASMSDMDEAELTLVLNRLKSDGFKPSSKGRSKHKTAARADLRLIHVLWRKLGDAGVLDKPNRAGLNAYIRSQFGNAWSSVPADVDMLRDHKQIEAVLQSLKAWGKRADIDFDWTRG
jgi:phage gp16-like protein